MNEREETWQEYAQRKREDEDAVKIAAYLFSLIGASAVLAMALLSVFG